MYTTSVYTIVKKTVNVVASTGFYNTKSVNDFVLWPYPHQSPNCCIGFVDYYNFVGPPYGRHDICVNGVGHGAQPTCKVIDTVGFGVAGPPPPGGGIIYDIPLPLGSAPEIAAPYFPGWPNRFPPWEPTRMDCVSSWETQICTANLTIYPPYPWGQPEYSVIQLCHIPPGAGGPPPIVDVDPLAMFPGAVPWDIGVDVTNAFDTGSMQDPVYGLFFYDYNIWAACGLPWGPIAPPTGNCWVYEIVAPLAQVRPISLPTSVGVFGPGPGIIDDSSQWGVCGSIAVDSQPVNQAGLVTPNPTLVYILDTELDIEIREIDFITGQNAKYGHISAGYMGAGYMAADIEMINTQVIAAANPPGYVPSWNLLAVAMVDGNMGPTQGDWWVDVYIVNPFNDNSVLFTSTPSNKGQPFMAMDVDETTGEIYVLHGSNSQPGNTAITVFKYL
jgi:hypothetical protein